MSRGWAWLLPAVLLLGCSYSRPGEDWDVESVDTKAAAETVPFASPPYADIVPETNGTVGGDYDVDVSPDGTWIAYASTRHSEKPSIFVKRTDGGLPQEKTHSAYRDVQPKISPDGQQIAYASDREGSFDIWVIPADGTPAAPWRVTNGPDDDLHPSWSPDGTRIAYSSRGERGDSMLWIIDLRTQKRRQLGPGLYPEWSPDGEYLAFQRPSQRQPGWYGIWIVPERGGAPIEIITEENWATIQPAWAPNSQYLVYGTARNRPGPAWQTPEADDLWIVDLHGRHIQLTEHYAPDYSPCWGLNGRIYFTSHRSGSPRIHSLDPGPLNFGSADVTPSSY